MSQFQRFAIVGAVVLSATLVFSGCTPEPELQQATKSAKPAPSSTKVITQSPSSTPLPSSETIQIQGESMDKSCESIFPVDRLYKYNANIGLIPNQPPTISPTSAQQLEIGGISCALMNLSSGATTEVVVTKLSPSSIKAKTQEIDLATSEGNYQVENGLIASFSGQTGQFMKNGYWVSVSSSDFGTAIDASKVSNLVAQGL